MNEKNVLSNIAYLKQEITKLTPDKTLLNMLEQIEVYTKEQGEVLDYFIKSF